MDSKDNFEIIAATDKELMKIIAKHTHTDGTPVTITVHYDPYTTVPGRINVEYPGDSYDFDDLDIEHNEEMNKLQLISDANIRIKAETAVLKRNIFRTRIANSMTRLLISMFKTAQIANKKDKMNSARL